ncbi:MAG: DUF928 domain-containing protein [Cyanobacteria bacterium P01_A01_bin.37]
MKRLLATSLICSTLISLIQSSSGVAEDHDSRLSSNNDDVIQRIVNPNFVPNNDGIPNRTAGGGSRNAGVCPTDSISHGASLVPILADDTQNLTALDHPSLLVYINNNEVSQLFLSVMGNEDGYDYQTVVPISEDSGILKIALPNDAPPLLAGSIYQWSLAIVCGESLRPDDPFVRGQIQRVELADAPRNTTIESVAFYVDNGVWYDAISTLADIRQVNAADVEVSSSWTALLGAVGLEEFASSTLLF